MNGNRSRAAASAARRPVVSPVPAGVDRPFWSVMIPTHESGDRLARTLESVLAQDQGPAEMQIRVIDDGSVVHDPRFVVADVAGPRVSVWRQGRNVGAPTNFTTCVQQAVGHWVHILHSDDLVRPGFYGRYRERIEASPGCVMVGGRSFNVDDDEQITGSSPEAVTDGGWLVDPMATIAADHPFNFVSVVVARSAYELLGGFDPALVHANDWEMWTRLAAVGPVAVVAEPLSMYRRHAESDTNRLQRSTAYLHDLVAAVDIIAERFDDPAEGRRFRRAARARWSAMALEVAASANARGERRNAWANASRAVQLRPDVATLRAAARLVGQSPSSGGRPRSEVGRRE
jgi:GT2 family glycosyltransferase